MRAKKNDTHDSYFVVTQMLLNNHIYTMNNVIMINLKPLPK